MDNLFNIDLTQGEDNLIELNDETNQETTETQEEVVDTTGKENTTSTEDIVNDDKTNENTIEIEDKDLENIKEDSTSTDTTQIPDNTDTEETSSLASYAAVLQEDGILPNLDIEAFNKIEDPEEQAETLLKAHEDRINEGITNWVQNLPDRLKHIIDNFQEGVPLETLIKADSNSLEFGKITEDQIINDENLQESLVIRDFIDRGFDKATAETMAQTLKDADKLEEQAKKSHTTLKTKDDARIEAEKVAAKEQEAAAKKTYEKQLADLNNLVTNTTEIIPGVQLSKTVKEQLLDSMTKPVGFDNEGNPVSKIIQARNENPQAFEMKLHYLFNLTNGFEDFSKITNTTKSRVVKKLSDRLQNTTHKAGRSMRVENKNKDVADSLIKSIKQRMS